MTRMPREWRVRDIAVVALIVATCFVSRVAGGQGAAGAPQKSVNTAGVVSGVVRDSLGSPVAGAHVSVGSAASVTDSSGAFIVRGLQPGPIVVNVRRLGFEPLVSRTELGDGGLSLDLRIRPVGALLPVVRVSARAEAYESRLAGFNARRAKKLGYYITREEIERRNDFSMTAALRRIPGVRPYTMRGALGRSVRGSPRRGGARGRGGRLPH